MLFVLLCFTVLLGVCAPHLLPWGSFQAELTSNSTGLPSQAGTIDSLTDSKWSEKLLLQGDLVSFTNMQVPQALQQATSRDYFPKSLFVLQGRPQWGFIPKQQEEGLWAGSCSLTVPRATKHTILGTQMCTPCLLIYSRQDQWGS